MFAWQVILDLEEERQRHAQDTAEGDDVTYMLEKERERLTQQVQPVAAHCPARGSMQLRLGAEWLLGPDHTSVSKEYQGLAPL